MGASTFLDDITLDELENDPYPAYARMRAEAPVAWVPAADVFLVTTFDDCALVGEGRRGFVGATGHPTLQRVFGKPNVLTSTGEQHDDLRAGTDPRLQAKSVNDTVDDIVRPVARQYLKQMRGRGTAELMSEYLEPVSVEALRRVMGLDDLVDSDTLRRWFHDLNMGVANFGLDPDIFAISDAASAEIEEVVTPRLHDLMKKPDDSMLSHMLWAGQRDRTPRSIELIMPSLKVILLGGMQEPGHAVGSTLHGLFSVPDQLALLSEDPEEYIPRAVNEGLRWIAPIGAVERQASQDIELRGVTIPAGSLVEVVLASANRDETRYDDPDRFDLLRSDRTHQAFGNGEHFCAGHFFARQVERIMLEELIPAVRGLRADPDREPVVSGWVFRAPKELPVLWDAEAESRESITVSTPELDETREMLVREMRWEADDVVSVILTDPSGASLEPWSPGAHVDIVRDEGRIAQYSLSGDPADHSSYRVSVLREEQGRGSSRYIHDELRVGQRVRVGGPRNAFELAPASSYLFIAGGIGVTTILPMVRQAALDGADFSVAYAARARERMAFIEELTSLAGAGLTLHIAAEGSRADLDALVAQAATTGTAVYACGPERMLDTLRDLGETHDVDVVMERFTPGEAHREGDTPFDLVLASTGATIHVDADETAISALERCGITVRQSCREGNCGSCETSVLAGRVDHRDVLLTPKGRAANDRMMVCVSRAADESITLDL
ncbi:MAG TPA: cytochrome P450 [Pseudolysinimonas sp.]|nr:cytochrome P450 [Pseudolysinimonas sp.]